MTPAGAIQLHESFTCRVPGTGADATPELATAAQAIQTAIGNLRTAQQSGDFAAQGTALAALDAAVQQFQAAQAAQPAG